MDHGYSFGCMAPRNVTVPTNILRVTNGWIRVSLDLCPYGGKASTKSARQSNLGVENPIVGVLISPVPRGAECGQRHRVPSLLGGDERATHNPIAEVSIAI